MHTVLQPWKNYLLQRACRNEMALTLIAFIASGAQSFHFLIQFEQRKGIQLNDFVHQLLPPKDLSTPIFITTYAVVAVSLFCYLKQPEKLMRGLQMFAVLSLLRTVTIYLVPLEAPANMIFLHDPFANMLLHTPSLAVTKDLFFSGHTAAIALLFFMADRNWLKWFCLAGLIASPTMILWQHVHYTIDVIAALPAAYFCYYLVNSLHARFANSGLLEWQR